MKKFWHKKNIIILSIIALITINIVTIFLWQFAYAADSEITTNGGTIASDSTIESIRMTFGGADAVNVIGSSGNYKVILKTNINLNGTINITSGNYTIVTDGENRTIKRNTTDSNSDGIFDFNGNLFNVTGGSLSFGEGSASMGISDVTYDNLITNNMIGTLTISGSVNTTDGYINNQTGYATKPSVTATSSLITASNGVINIWPEVNVVNNYSTFSCIDINTNSTFNMYGGSISKCIINDNESVGGSALSITSSTFNLYDGIISNNEAVGTNINAGAIYVNTNSTTNIYGGMINHNIDSNDSSGLTINNSTLNMYGGTLYDNVGSDLYLLSSVTATINNGYVDKFASAFSSNTTNIINGVINNQLATNTGTVTYNGKNTTHYELTIPDGSSTNDKDYVKIYDSNDTLVTFYEGPLLTQITSLKFYLEAGDYYAIIDQSKTYYFNISNNLTVTPSGISSTDETFGSNNDGTITGLTNTMEMSLDNLEYMEVPSYPTVENVPTGDYYIREIGQNDYVKISVRGTLDVTGGTLTATSSVSQVESVFGGSDIVNVTKSNSEYLIELKSHVLLSGPITITSGDYTIISDGGDYVIKRDINSFTNDMFKVNGGNLTFGSSVISNDTTNAIKYSFVDEEIISDITANIPERAVAYLKRTKTLTGIQNTMKGSIILDGGSVIENGYINSSGNGVSTTTSPVAGVLINIISGTVNINNNITLTNNYNNGTRIDGSAIYVDTNGILKMYGGLITKCVRNSTANTSGTAIYNKGLTYIYNGEIAYNETRSNAIAKGTIFNNGQLYVTYLNLHHNWVKGLGGGIYATTGATTSLYNGNIKNNISFNYTNTTNNTYTNPINDDLYLEKGSSVTNITNGTYGYIKTNGSNTLKITEANVDNISINDNYNEVTLYPLVTLTNALNIENNTANDITTSVSNNLNFINLTTKSITTFNSSSTLNISFYHEYDNSSNYRRSLVFSNNLPANTSIILRRVRGNVITNYYYKNASTITANTPIYLTEFKQLGTTTSFVEATALTETIETIDLIIDFEYNGKMENGKVTYVCGDSYSTTNYIIDDSDEFALEDFTVDDKGLITGGNITANPAIYSNFFYGKDSVIILTLNNGTSNIPFVVTNGTNTYKPAGTLVNMASDTINGYTIKNIDGKNLPDGTYTLTARLSMTSDNRVNKYSTLDGVLLTKTYNFTTTGTNYGLTLNSDNKRTLTINDENQGIFNFNITKTNLTNGTYQIRAYKKTGSLTYNTTAESNWTITENNSVITVTIPTTTTSGTYKMVLSYVINSNEVVTKEYNLIIKNN